MFEVGHCECKARTRMLDDGSYGRKSGSTAQNSGAISLLPALFINMLNRSSYLALRSLKTSARQTMQITKMLTIRGMTDLLIMLLMMDPSEAPMKKKHVP